MHKFLPMTVSDQWASVSALSGTNSGTQLELVVAVWTHHAKRVSEAKFIGEGEQADESTLSRTEARAAWQRIFAIPEKSCLL